MPVQPSSSSTASSIDSVHDTFNYQESIRSRQATVEKRIHGDKAKHPTTTDGGQPDAPAFSPVGFTGGATTNTTNKEQITKQQSQVSVSPHLAHSNDPGTSTDNKGQETLDSVKVTERERTRHAPLQVHPPRKSELWWRTISIPQQTSAHLRLCQPAQARCSRLPIGSELLRREYRKERLVRLLWCLPR